MPVISNLLTDLCSQRETLEFFENIGYKRFLHHSLCIPPPKAICVFAPRIISEMRTSRPYYLPTNVVRIYGIESIREGEIGYAGGVEYMRLTKNADLTTTGWSFPQDFIRYKSIEGCFLLTPKQ